MMFKIYNNFIIPRKLKKSILLIGNFDGLHLGHQKVCKEAKNTKTNAVEVIKWMKKNNLISAILVTSDIHLPRSILEFQNNTNHIKITSWPVKTNSNNFINFLKEFLRFSFVRIKYLII